MFWTLFYTLYAMETYNMHFLEPARFLNAPDLAWHKVNVLYEPALAQRPAPWNNRSVLICIKLPIKLFFYMGLPLMILMQGKDITWTIGRGGPKNLNYSRWHFRPQKSLDFQGLPLLIAQVMSLPRIKIIMARSI